MNGIGMELNVSNGSTRSMDAAREAATSATDIANGYRQRVARDGAWRGTTGMNARHRIINNGRSRIKRKSMNSRTIRRICDLIAYRLARVERASRISQIVTARARGHMDANVFAVASNVSPAWWRTAA